MKTKLLAILTLSLMMFNTSLHARFSTEDPLYVRLECNGTDIVRQTHQTDTFLTWDGREVCYEIKVECKNALFFNTWFEWTWDGRPAVRWFAVAFSHSDPADYGMCGDYFDGAVDDTWLPIPWKKWNTSCNFFDKSGFFANSKEIEAANCKVED